MGEGLYLPRVTECMQWVAFAVLLININVREVCRPSKGKGRSAAAGGCDAAGATTDKQHVCCARIGCGGACKQVSAECGQITH
jgi:hypothetical protein